LAMVSGTIKRQNDYFVHMGMTVVRYDHFPIFNLECKRQITPTYL